VNRVFQKRAGLQNRITFTVGLVLVWQVLSANGILDSVLIPGPVDVYRALIRLGLDVFVGHTISTVSRAVAGFLIGVTVGVGLGIVVKFSAFGRFTIEPLVDTMRPVPPVALIPFFILIFGFSEVGRVVLVVLAVSVILAVATAEAIENMPETWFRFPVACGFNRLQLIGKVVLPGVVPFLKGPTRVALSVTLTLVIVSEFMGAQSGLGYLTNVSRVNLSTDVIMLAIIALGLSVQLLDKLLLIFFSTYTDWFEQIQRQNRN
jgi:ABC-type nitrate/sulfonate/bicarbonate transport system permease component